MIHKIYDLLLHGKQQGRENEHSFRQDKESLEPRVIATIHGTPFRCLSIIYARFRSERVTSDVM